MSIQKDKVPLYILILSSILLLACLFTANYRLMGLGFLQYILTLGTLMSIRFHKSGITFRDFSNHVNVESNKDFEENNHVKSSVYGLVIPIVFVGLIWICISVYAMLFVL